MKAKHTLILSFLLSIPSLSQQFWEVSPPYEAWIKNICYVNNDTIFAATAKTYAIYRSTNGGLWWEPAVGGMFGYRFAYCITKAADRFIFVGSDSGIFRSSDMGLTWIRTSTDTLKINSIAFHPPNILVAGTMSNVLLRSTDTGKTWSGIPLFPVGSVVSATTGFMFASGPSGYIYRSTDYGISWNLMHPTLYDVNDFIEGPGGSILAAASSYGVYRSTDNGVTWQVSNAGINGDFIASLVADPRNSAVIYAGGGYGVFQSVDSGKTWTKITSISCSDIAMNRKGIIIMGNLQSMLRSTNDGNTWIESKDGLTNINLEYADRRNQILFTADPFKNFYISKDGGKTWTFIRPGRASLSGRPVIADSGRIFIGESSKKMNFSSDTGKTWSQIAIGSSSDEFLEAARSSTGVIYIGGYHSLYLSTNNGWNWVSKNASLPSGNITRIFTGLNNSMFISVFISTFKYGLFRSLDSGSTWISIGPDTARVYSFINPSPNLLFIGTRDHGVYRSTNNGVSWERIVAGLSHPFVAALAMSSPDRLFAGTYGGGVFMSSDSGRTWTPYSTGLRSLAISDFVLDPSDHLFAVTHSGLARSIYVVPVRLSAFTATLDGIYARLAWRSEAETNNAGYEVERYPSAQAPPGGEEQWERIGFVPGNGTTSEPRQYAFEDALPPSLLSLHVVRYRLRQIDYDGSSTYSSVAEVYPYAPDGFDVQVYPNPVTPSQNSISLAISRNESETVSLALFDALGRVVYESQSVLINGKNTLTVPLSSLSRGVYRLVAQSGGVTRVQSVVVMR